MDVPQITVAMPVYNGEGYVHLAIQTVLDQTYSDFELLIVDNCSTDGTLEVVKAFSDPRIRLHVNSSNLGMVGNWNRSVELATGEYIKFLSHDDLLDPTCLEEQIAGFLQHKQENIGIVTCKKRVINQNGKNVMPGFGLRGQSRLISGRVAIRKSIRAGRNIIGEPSVVLIKTSALRESGLFELPEFTPDIKMWFKILQKSELYFIDKTLASYRISEKSTSSSVSKSQGAQFVTLIHEITKTDSTIIGKLNARIGSFRSHLNSQLRRLITRISSS
jgi:glycosyltransferase involved in cell wall biosynthesis